MSRKYEIIDGNGLAAGPQDIWRGGWSKFSKYEIRDDRIRPAEGAHIEHYDPWEIYRKSKMLPAVLPPYQEFLALALALGAYRDSKSGCWVFKQWAWDDDQRAQVLTWCAKYGLLGILSHVTHTINLRHPSLGLDGGYIRVNGKWIEYQVGPTGTIPDYPKSPVVPAEPRSAVWMDWGDFPADQRRALHDFIEGTGKEKLKIPLPVVRDDRTAQPRTASISEVAELYFPEHLHEGVLFACPKPLTDRFWRIYSEKLESFAWYALMFTAAVHDPVPKLVCSLPDRLNPGLETLVAPIGISLESDERGKISEHWTCPSLLSSFARMALQDLISGKRLLRCECCGNPFPSDAYQALYCSKQCGYKLRKRRARATSEKGRT